ncbi:hypothetical protein [Limnoglobus roseus]|uniref:Uncharacterized protein n=1 Tax=Limnoglobus roseus TaxID=2598579 RepID=A0A5C1ANH6_9BACT|nr:hypothetical protein [Limnoglobus roseus]QEL19292.1 hypothetical protein PX52LOC_06355 [Limnoglobus roseus]
MQSFSLFAESKLKELGKNVSDLAYEVGYGKSIAYKWMTSNRWPREAFERICLALQIPAMTPDEAEVEYEMKFFSSPKRPATDPFGILDRLRDLPPTSLRAANDLVMEAFGLLNKKHAVIIATTTLIPAPFSTEPGSKMAAAVCQAIKNGCCFLFHTPDVIKVEQLKTDFGSSDGVEEVATFKSGFTRLRNRLIDVLEAEGELEWESRADCHLQIVATQGAFDFVSASETTTLISESGGQTNWTKRVLKRTPGTLGRIDVQPPHDLNETRMRRFYTALTRTKFADGTHAEKMFRDEFCARLSGHA